MSLFLDRIKQSLKNSQINNSSSSNVDNFINFKNSLDDFVSNPVENVSLSDKMSELKEQYFIESSYNVPDWIVDVAINRVERAEKVYDYAEPVIEVIQDVGENLPEYVANYIKNEFGMSDNSNNSGVGGILLFGIPLAVFVMSLI